MGTLYLGAAWVFVGDERRGQRKKHGAEKVCVEFCYLPFTKTQAIQPHRHEPRPRRFCAAFFTTAP